MIDRGLNTPVTSSVGRLFDAASALLGVCVQPGYEGEGAVLLESCMSGFEKGSGGAAAHEVAPSQDDEETRARYAVAVTKNTATETSTAHDTSVLLLDAEPTFRTLLDDVVQGVPVAVIARRFHDAIVGAVLMVAELARALYGIDVIALSGGVFMNRYLVEHALDRLETAGFSVAINRDLPPNDGCVSYGQAVVAWAQEKAR